MTNTTGFNSGMGRDPNRRQIGKIFLLFGTTASTFGGAQAAEFMKKQEKKDNRHAKRRETLVQTQKVDLFIANSLLDRVDPKMLLNDTQFLGFGPKKANHVSYLEVNPYPNAFQSMLGKEWNPSFSYFLIGKPFQKKR